MVVVFCPSNWLKNCPLKSAPVDGCLACCAQEWKRVFRKEVACVTGARSSEMKGDHKQRVVVHVIHGTKGFEIGFNGCLGTSCSHLSGDADTCAGCILPARRNGTGGDGDGRVLIGLERPIVLRIGSPPQGPQAPPWPHPLFFFSTLVFRSIRTSSSNAFGSEPLQGTPL